MPARERFVVVCALLSLVSAFAADVARAQATPAAQPDVSALLKRIDEQEQRIRQLEDKLENLTQQASGNAHAQVSSNSQARTQAQAAPAAAAAAASQPGGSPAPLTAESALSPSAAVGNLSPQGIYLQSADGANVIRFRGNLAVDGRWYTDSVTPESADTWLLRKARPYFEGTLDNIYDFRFMPDFANGKSILVEAYAAARLAPWFVLQAGKFKAPVGLERLQPDQYDRFIELGLPSSIVPNRNLGLQVAGDVGAGLIGYALGAFDGATDGQSTDSNPTPDASPTGRPDYEARLFAQPFARFANPYLRGFGIGIAGTYANFVGTVSNPLVPSYKTPGQLAMFSYRTGTTATYANGQQVRWSPQLYYYAGSFGLIAEYAESSQEVARRTRSSLLRTGTMNNSAWQVSMGYFLTGEVAAYNAFSPYSTFKPGTPGWGAWEIVARYHELTVDEAAFLEGADSFADPTTSARAARALGAGINWYLNRNLRWMLDFEHTRFELGAKNGSRAPEDALFTQLQLTF